MIRLSLRPDLNAVAHLHTIPGMAVSALERGLMFITQGSMMFYGRVGYHKFEGIARLDEQERIIRDLGTRNTALILHNHGLLTCGASVAAATTMMGELVNTAQVQLAVLASGEEVIEPSPQVCEETAKMFDRNETSIGDDWEAVLRWLDTQDSSNRD